MPKRNDIAYSANFLLYRHGKDAPKYAERMFKLHLAKDDVKITAQWMGLMAEVETQLKDDDRNQPKNR